MEQKLEKRICQNCRLQFTIEPDDFSFYEKIKVPAPTFCPECRMQRRFTFRNERVLHRNKCAKTGKSVISCFSSESPFIIYDRDIWWSDKWDPTEYGMDYDFSRPFFKQFRELLEKVPQPNLFIGKCTDTLYGNHIGEFKNSYLVSASWLGENINYASRCNESKDSMDMFTTVNCEFCYDDVSCVKCYETFYSQNAVSCVSSYFLYDCKNCTNCFGCTNLRNKSYCIWNEQLTKEEYFKKLSELNIGNYNNFKKIKEEFNKFKLSALRRFSNIVNSSNVSGDDITNASNSHDCFYVANNIKDCRFLINAIDRLNDSYDGYGVGANTQLLYEGIDSGVNGSMQLFTATSWECLNTEYSYNCHGCNNLFACVGLRENSYCIFNKQYSKGEYIELKKKIIEHMNNIPYTDKKGNVYKYGEFFPAEISPFGYNETVAEDYFPLSEDDIKSNGYNFLNPDKSGYTITHTSKDIPDDIKDIKETILDYIIECESCNKGYKIIQSEYEFLKRFNLPIPRKCFECRHKDRFNQVNPPKLWHRSCMKEGCTNTFETSYVPERPEIIYCEKCYQNEVY
ncbi:TPA: hypothetical protein DCQ22_00170 [Candidatus Nomurabacteria bacterium]|nr:hypothetical protein [Candidatus Nomurabacteria bacterium]